MEMVSACSMGACFVSQYLIGCGGTDLSSIMAVQPLWTGVLLHHVQPTRCL